MLSKSQRGNETIEKTLNIHVLRMMNAYRRWPLDYILNCSHAKSKLMKDEYSRGRLRRQNIFKNCVFRKLLSIRKDRSRPSLGALLRNFKFSDQQSNEELR